MQVKEPPGTITFPKSLAERYRETSDGLTADMRKDIVRQLYFGPESKPAEMNGLKNIVHKDIVHNGGMKMHEYDLKYSVTYDEAEACEAEQPSPKQLRKQAKRLLKQAARIEAQRKADRKAKKAAAKREKQREAERQASIDVLREIATKTTDNGFPWHTDKDRMKAAIALIDRDL